MNKEVFTNQHEPCAYRGIIGCNGYTNTSNIVCMTANGDNNFVDEGIVENSILFIDTSVEFVEGMLNVFKLQANCSPQYKLSRKDILNAEFFGKVIMTVKQYQ